ncbi:hypothetical protein HYU18_03285 [Candidatus Woesearchaeota archaeon]|nr:hypothetical protein [Candidatus Woesearchaeota archaeon]
MIEMSLSSKVRGVALMGGLAALITSACAQAAPEVTGQIRAVETVDQGVGIVYELGGSRYFLWMDNVTGNSDIDSKEGSLELKAKKTDEKYPDMDAPSIGYIPIGGQKNITPNVCFYLDETLVHGPLAIAEIYLTSFDRPVDCSRTTYNRKDQERNILENPAYIK